MAREVTFAKLRNVLADLYLDEASATRVASDAGVELGRIDLSSSAANRWHAILREAENTGRIEALFAVVLGEYGEHAELRDTIDAYRRDEVAGEQVQDGEDFGGRGPIRKWLPLAGIVAVVIAAAIGYSVYRSGQGAAVPPTITAAPTATATLLPTSTPTPEPTAPEPTATQTPAATPTPPDFISLYVYDADWDVEQVEFDFEEGTLPTETISDFVQVSRLAYVEFEDGTRGFNVHLVVTNTSERPLLLTLDPRFFSFEDDQARKAELIYFCCAAQGEFLAPGQDRTAQLLFRAVPGWEGKLLTADSLFFRVRGLLPVVRASWRVPPLATGA